jgi:hypothetical protein
MVTMANRGIQFGNEDGSEKLDATKPIDEAVRGIISRKNLVAIVARYGIGWAYRGGPGWL